MLDIGLANISATWQPKGQYTLLWSTIVMSGCYLFEPSSMRFLYESLFSGKIINCKINRRKKILLFRL